MPPKARTWLSRQPQAQPVDLNAHIGARLRLRRMAMSLTQAELAGAMGITQAQLQSYERGTTRVAAARLYRFSRCLSVPAEYFFEGLEEPPAPPASAGKKARTSEEGAPSPPQEPPADKDTAAVLRAFRRISRPEDRKAILAFLGRLDADEAEAEHPPPRKDA